MNHPLRVPFHISGRVKPNSQVYFAMCADSLVRYRAQVRELGKLEHLSPSYAAAFDRAERLAIEPIVFAGMCLEASLYDLGACLFGGDFAAHIDKLDPVGKFVVIAQYVDGNPPDPSGITLQSIRAVVTARNKLIHHKSQSMLDGEWEVILTKMKRAHDQQLNGILNSFRALVLLSLYFDGNIVEELRILPSFKTPEYWKQVIPLELHEDVKWCIEAARNTSDRV